MAAEANPRPPRPPEILEFPVATIEPVAHAVPLDVRLLDELGLHGIHPGCGSRLIAGALNTDLAFMVDDKGGRTEPGRLVEVDCSFYYLQHDAGKRYPLPEGCFEWAFSEHMIEHLAPRQAVAWLRDLRRLLKEGSGFVRICTPDLRRYVEGYLDPDNHFYEQNRRRIEAMKLGRFANSGVPDRNAWMLNHIFYMWGHQWIYDVDELRHAATSAGFTADSVVECAFRQGKLPNVAALDQEWRRDESVYVEIRR